MKVIVGLGNPGSEYELTRHNAGFQVMRRLSTMTGGEWKIVKNLQAAVIKGRIGSHDVVLAMPQTFMNLSGHAAVAILQWFKLSHKDMLVIHDDVSINLGRLKFQQAGSAGGQHGIESIIKQLGGLKDFDRLKFGVGPDPGGASRANYVLGKVSQTDWWLYEKCINSAADAVGTYLDKGMLEAMNGVNGVNFGMTEAEEKLEAEKKRLKAEQDKARKESLEKERLEKERLEKERLEEEDENPDAPDDV
ncbi:MAG: aminoacyl-tRNA hydrolase [Candidatus Obscuribacterales bacterium]|nr:aminoacyl-tRNA hydrolase [Candidatus Obscuribacterales bacterium]